MDRAIIDESVIALKADWKLWAADAQLPPGGDWLVWLLMGGRGSGKTRAGAERNASLLLARRLATCARS
jgi:phage terminase large subunit-like protein